MMRFLALPLLFMPVTAAFAQEAGCYNGPLQIGEKNPLRLMRIAADVPRVNFIEEKSDKKPACPSLSEACKRKGFLLAGDEVMAGMTQGDLVCVSYIAPDAKRVKGRFTETSGFLPASALEPAGSPPPKPGDFAWRWLRPDGEATIEISLNTSNTLRIKGEATFGLFDPVRIKRGTVSSGELVAEKAAIRGNAVAMGEGYTNPANPPSTDGYECQARLRLYGRYLAVEDNMQCGGINVSFVGFYIREK
jgi:hypothetical protein